METTNKTAHVAEALKHLHEASQHVLDAMTEQLGSQEAANNYMLVKWQPTIEPVEQLLRQVLGDIVNDSALRAATAAFMEPDKANAKWRV